MPVDSQTLAIIGVVAVLLLIIFLVPMGGKGCSCGEGYSSPQSASFTVNHPKYNTAPVSPVKREGFMIPIPSKAQTLVAAGMPTGGLTKPTSNPWMGGLQGEVTYGTSVPGTNSAQLLAGNGAGNVGAKAVWATII
jgi:hypothetical protein